MLSFQFALSDLVRDISREELESSSESEGYMGGDDQWSDCGCDEIERSFRQTWISRGPGFDVDF